MGLSVISHCTLIVAFLVVKLAKDIVEPSFVLFIIVADVWL